jgi:hypothetical protein
MLHGPEPGFLWQLWQSIGARFAESIRQFLHVDAAIGGRNILRIFRPRTVDLRSIFWLQMRGVPKEDGMPHGMIGAKTTVFSAEEGS